VSHSSFKVRLDTHFNSSRQIIPMMELKEKKKAPVKVMPTISPSVEMNISQNKSANDGNAYKSMGVSVGPPPVINESANDGNAYKSMGVSVGPPVYSSGDVNAGMNDVENQVSATNTNEAIVKKEVKNIIVPTIAPNAPTRSFLDRATSFPLISPHFQMVPKVVPNDFQSEAKKEENRKNVGDKMEETSSPGNQKLLQEESSVYKKAIEKDLAKLSLERDKGKMEESSSVLQLRKMQQEESSVYKKAIIDKDEEVDTQKLSNKLSKVEENGYENESENEYESDNENEKGRKEENIKSREEIESLSSLEDNSVIREDVLSETFSPSKASLSLKQCVNIIRDQLHIKDTSVGAVIRLALEEFDTPELTERCNMQRTPLHKTHIIITEGLGMSLSDDPV
jgi:hypothetical protein